jgi:hypothetical protein
MSQTLMHASAEWSKRRWDECYESLSTMEAELAERDKRKFELTLAYSDIDVVPSADTDDICLSIPGKTERVPLALSHFAFDQFLDRLDMSAREERKFPRELVIPRVKHQLGHAMTGRLALPAPDRDIDDDIMDDLGTAVSKDQNESQIKVFGYKNGQYLTTSITSAGYGRMRSLDLVRAVQPAEAYGFKPPLAFAKTGDPRTRVATQEDVDGQCFGSGCPIIAGQSKISPAGLYLGDRNMFLFLVNFRQEVAPGLYRFVTISNSEEGEFRPLEAVFGALNGVCGNHIIWGAQGVKKVRAIHRREPVKAFGADLAQALESAMSAPPIPVALWNLAKSTTLGTDMKSVVDNVYKRRFDPTVTQRVLECAYEQAENHPEDSDGAPPTSVLGFVNGLTRASQFRVTKDGLGFGQHADRRHKLDIMAGKLLDTLKLEDAAQSANVPATIDVTGTVTSVTKRGRKSS